MAFLSRSLSTSAGRAAESPLRLSKAAGDISSVFPSLRPDYRPKPLPARFQELKLGIFEKNQRALEQSWARLLASLAGEVQTVRARGSSIIPSIQYLDIVSGTVPSEALDEIRRRGSVVVRNVVPRSTALDWKERLKQYIAANRERVKAYPADSPAVYELYWAPAQVEARACPGVLESQRFLQRLWHSSDPTTRLSATHPLTYADRLRIRQPGDAKFTLGPHMDGGSLERWEDAEYSRVYAKILEGRWEEYDPFDAKHRVNARMDLYNGAGACSMLRFFQGWLSLSDTSPGEGSLRVGPMLAHSTAYTMLRPFFDPLTSTPVLDASFPGAIPGACQEFSAATHPHLELDTTMVPVPSVEPGDYVAWHCDSLHAVDKTHAGQLDSSVLYIPATPLCHMNTAYLVNQRSAALSYSPPGDFPAAGGPGEQGFRGAMDWPSLTAEGLQAMGMGSKPWQLQPHMSAGERAAVEQANALCFANQNI